MKEKTHGYITLFALVAYYNIMSLCVTVPEYVITELYWYVVLDFPTFNNLLQLKHLSRGVVEAASKHMD